MIKLKSLLTEQNADFWNQYTSNGTKPGKASFTFPTVPLIWSNSGTQLLGSFGDPQNEYPIFIGLKLVAEYLPNQPKTSTERFKYFVNVFVTKKAGDVKPDTGKDDNNLGFFGYSYNPGIKKYDLYFTKTIGGVEDFGVYYKDKQKGLNKLNTLSKVFNFYALNTSLLPNELVTQLNDKMQLMGFPSFPKSATIGKTV